MGKASYGTGTLFKRGRIWYLSYYVNGRQVQRSSRSNNIQDAKRLRDEILGKKARGEMGDSASQKIRGCTRPASGSHQIRGQRGLVDVFAALRPAPPSPPQPLT